MEFPNYLNWYLKVITKLKKNILVVGIQFLGYKIARH